MSLYRCPSCGAAYTTNDYESCVVCGHEFKVAPLCADEDEHSPYYSRPSVEHSSVIGGWSLIACLVIVAGYCLWQAFS